MLWHHMLVFKETTQFYKIFFLKGLTPTLVQGAISGKTVLDVACGSHHSICLTSDGDLYAWGKINRFKITNN